MTHFVGLVMCDTRNEIDNLVEMYCERNEVAPYFQPIDGEDLERMKNFYTKKEQERPKVSGEEPRVIDEQYLISVMDDWNGGEGVVKDGVLGYMSTYNPLSTWDWFEVGGRWRAMVPDNNCLASEIPTYFTEYLPSVIVTKEDGWLSAKEWGWFGTSKPSDTEMVVKDTLAANPDKRVWIVDFHI